MILAYYLIGIALGVDLRLQQVNVARAKKNFFGEYSVITTGDTSNNLI